MKRILSLMPLIVVAVLLVSVMGASAQGGGPQSPAALDTTFTYQGQLKNASGPVTGNCDFQFNLWNDPMFGMQMGPMVTVPNQAVTNGTFTVQLDFGSNAFDGGSRWLSIGVRCPAGSGSYATLTPRQSLTPTPYALTADRLVWGASWSGNGSGIGLSLQGGAGGLNANGAEYGVWSSGPITGTVGEATNTTGTSYGVLGLTRSAATDAAGVYGVSPAGRGVFGSTGTGYGLYGLASAPGGFGLMGYASSGSGYSIGVFGQSNSTSGRGLYGHATATTGNAEGVIGRSDSNAGYGVEGYTTAISGTTYGVFGEAFSPQGFGVYGRAPMTGTVGIATADEAGVGVYGVGGLGVYGVSSANYGIGVWGSANNGVGSIGVWGNSINGYAGFFTGKVFVNTDLVVGGNFSAVGTKAFKIDHPLNPDKQYLYHYAIEAPEVQNLYNGTIMLDMKGEAVVTLPDYFSALNGGEFRYTLTAIGAPMPDLYIAQEVSGNTFKIAGGMAGKKVSWTVFAQRNDPWLRDHPATDVVDKPTNEIGTYLYPQGYGQPENTGVTYSMQKRLGGQ